MDGISALMGPGQAQILLLKKAMDTGKANAAGLLQVLIPPAQVQAPQAGSGRIDISL